jgi:hypothetical protein
MKTGRCGKMMLKSTRSTLPTVTTLPAAKSRWRTAGRNWEAGRRKITRRHYSNYYYAPTNTRRRGAGSYGENPRGITDKMTSADILRMAEPNQIPFHHDIWSNFQADPQEIRVLWEMKKPALWLSISGSGNSPGRWIKTTSNTTIRADSTTASPWNRTCL